MFETILGRFVEVSSGKRIKGNKQKNKGKLYRKNPEKSQNPMLVHGVKAMCGTTKKEVRTGITKSTPLFHRENRKK